MKYRIVIPEFFGFKVHRDGIISITHVIKNIKIKRPHLTGTVNDKLFKNQICNLSTARLILKLNNEHYEYTTKIITA